MKITLKLVLLFCLCIGLVYGVFSTYLTYDSARIMKEDARQDTDALVELYSCRINGYQYAIRKLIDGTSIAFRQSGSKDIDYHPILAEIVSNEEMNIVGSTFAFNDAIERKAPYCWRKNGTLSFTDIAKEYDYWNQEWYTKIRDSGDSYWGKPYVDFNIWMITYSKRVNDENGNFKGVLTADISLDWISGFMAEMGGENGFVFLLNNQTGEVISSFHPNNRYTADSMHYCNAIESTWKEHFKLVQKGESVKSVFYDSGRKKNYYVVFSPLPAGNWSVGVLFEEDKVLLKVNEMIQKSGIILVAGFLFILIVIIMLAKSLTKPLRKLTLVAQKIGKGNLDETIDFNPKGRDEIAILGRTLQEMQNNLKQHIRLLEKTTAQKQKIESELRIAHDMQQSMLPSTNTLNSSTFDIYASLRPAKEVGGDLYDFFMIDNQHLCLIIGDVSDKGVPAALFMAITDTYVKAFSKENFSPASILVETNKQLCETNEMCMFVSLFCCVINLHTGECHYSNAGHNPPFILSVNNRIKKIQTRIQPVLGVFPDREYVDDEIVFLPSDRLILYTDGITEAMNEENKEFGETLLVEAISGTEQTDCKDLGEKIMQQVERFTAGALPSDDRTLLVFQLKTTL